MGVSWCCVGCLSSAFLSALQWHPCLALDLPCSPRLLVHPHLTLLLRTFTRMYSYLCPHLRLFLRTFSEMFLYFKMWRSMQQSGLSLPFVFVCAFFMTSSHPFSIVAFASGINITWDDRSFVCASRFPKAYVSERQISRVIWTIPNSRFPKFADQNHIRSSYFLLPRFTLESISYSPDFFKVTWRILSHRYAVPRDLTTCACFHLQRKLGEELP